MQTDVIFVLAMIIALVGSAIFLKGIFTASKPRERFVTFLKYAACVTVFLICAWGFVFTNDLLWYGQNPENETIELEIDAAEVEETSFLYLLEELGTATSPEDVVALMGTNFEEHTEGSYVIRYTAPGYTLMGEQPQFISFVFSRDRTRILNITWSYKDPAPELFAQLRDYLESNAFGKASAYSANGADWVGLHLEDTGEYLLLQRIF